MEGLRPCVQQRDSGAKRPVVEAKRAVALQRSESAAAAAAAAAAAKRVEAKPLEATERIE